MEGTYEEDLVPLDNQLERPRKLVPLDHRHLDLPPPLLPRHDPISVLLLLLLRRAGPSRSLGGPIEVPDPLPIPRVVEAHDEVMQPRGEEDEEEEGVQQGRSEAGVVVARPAPGRDAVPVEKLDDGARNRVSFGPHPLAGRRGPRDRDG